MEHDIKADHAITVDWYFDYISPFAYLQSKQLKTLPDHVQVRYRPILFAGLLNHFKQLGPAEIERKRDFTYQYVFWLAAKHGISLRFPPAHPFNPLPLLRLTHACDNRPAVIHGLFDFVWAEGRDMSSDNDWRKIVHHLGVAAEEKLTKHTEIKEKLHQETAAAVGRGIFGVPTFWYRDELFWGFDGFEMFKEFLLHPEFFDDPERRRLRNLGSAASRL